MSYTLTLEKLNLAINYIVMPFLDTYNIEPIENTIDELENNKEEFYLRAILLLRKILEEELTYKYERFFKEFIIISTLEEIRNNYIDYYKENKGEF